MSYGVTKSSTWYSQNSTHDTNENELWNFDYMDSVVFPNSSSSTKVFMQKKLSGDWMDVGCYITSLAMLLNDLSYTYKNKHDMRIKFTGNLVADPYTVMLANNNSDGYFVCSNLKVVH